MTTIASVEISNDRVFNLWYDDSSYFYDELWEGVSFISNSRKFNSEGKESQYITIEDLIDENGEPLKTTNGLEVQRVFIYDHGNIALSLKPFNCRWDSGTLGFILFKSGEFGENNQGLDGFLQSWESVVNGDVYGFTVEEKVNCKHCNNHTTEVLDSYGGFYGFSAQKDLFESMFEHVSDLTEEDKKKINNLL